MREVTETTPPDLQSFSTVRILKESWEICTKYFGALVMPLVLIILACMPSVFIVPGKPGEALNNILLAIFMPIGVMGLHHSVLRLKSEGKLPTFSQTFSFGNEFWGRGFRIGLLLGVYTFLVVIGSMIAAAIPFVPGTMLIDKHPIPGAILVGLGGLLFLGALAWFAARSCLAYSAMADGLTSATRAFELGWEMTKPHIKKTLNLGFALTGILVIIIFVFILAAAIMAGLGIADEDTLTVVFIFAGLIVYLFGLAYTHVCLNLTYQALKPAPREENQLPTPTN
jgi:hypothetical protein